MALRGCKYIHKEGILLLILTEDLNKHSSLRSLMVGQWIHLVTASSKVKIKYEQLEQTIIYLTL